jgi:hypothetical protein
MLSNFEQTVFLTNEQIDYGFIGLFAPFELKIDPNGILSDEYKVQKIKYLLNGTEFHTETLNLDQISNGNDPRNVIVSKKFLYDEGDSIIYNQQLITIQVYVMTIPFVWEYRIWLNFKYPSMADISENKFFDSIKLLKSRPINSKELLYIFEATKRIYDDLSTNSVNEKFLLPVKVEWLDQENLTDIKNQVVYDINPMAPVQTFVSGWEDYEDLMAVKNKDKDTYSAYLTENSVNQQFSIKNNTIVKETTFNKTKKTEILNSKLPRPESLNLDNFTFKFSTLARVPGSETSKKQKDFFEVFLREELTERSNLKEGVLVYIPNSQNLKKHFKDAFEKILYDGDVGSLTLKTGEQLRVKRINRNNFYTKLSDADNLYKSDIYLLISNKSS